MDGTSDVDASLYVDLMFRARAMHSESHGSQAGSAFVKWFPNMRNEGTSINKIFEIVHLRSNDCQLAEFLPSMCLEWLILSDCPQHHQLFASDSDSEPFSFLRLGF